jgi:hypothetical protein
VKQLLLCFWLLSSFVLHAQVNEDFSDGNFTSAPTWLGDDTLFIVNAANALQSNGTAGKDISLVTANALSAPAEWQILAKFSFSPSTQNFCRFYLMSDQTDLKGSLNGYYVQFGGVTGSTDSITLYRQAGTTRIRLIGGRPSTVSRSSNTVRVRVRRDNLGAWELASDTTGGFDFTMEGNGTDNTFTSSAWMGVFARFTNSNASAFQFDEVYAGPFITDTTAPVIDTVTVMDANNIRVSFSEDVELSSALNTANYIIGPHHENPVQVVATGSGQRSFMLTLTSALVNENEYSVKASGIEDLNGNICDSTVFPFLWFVPGIHSVLITELFPDPVPSQGLPDKEFIELYNNSSVSINLAGWRLTDGSGTATIQSATLAPGAFAIVCVNADSLLFKSYGRVVSITGTFPSLNNTSDTIRLLSPASLTVHQLAYTLDWYRDVAKQGGGWTLEMLNPKNLCRQDDNWKASSASEGGSPGMMNSGWSTSPDTDPPLLLAANLSGNQQVDLVFSERMDSASLIAATINVSGGLSVISKNVKGKRKDTLSVIFSQPVIAGTAYTITVTGASDCAGNIIGSQNAASFYKIPTVPAQPLDIIFNELMPDPDPPVVLPAKEFIELYNRSSRIISTKGWKLTDATGNYTLNEYILYPDSFLILCSQADAAVFASYGAVLPMPAFPSLSNSGELLTLTDANGMLVHSVNYSDAWYKDAGKKSGGFSLELINPLALCREEDNWIATVNVDGGTPGMRNSVHIAFPDTVGPRVRDLHVDSVSLRLVFDERMEPASLMAESFLINGSVPASIQVNGSRFDTVLLVVSAPFVPDVQNTLFLGGVQDCAGNLVAPGTSIGFIYERPVEPVSFGVLINEIMPDPDPVIGLPAAEYVELMNRSNGTIDLAGWTLSAGGSVVALPSIYLRKDSLLLLTSVANAGQFSSIPNVRGVSGFPALANDGGTLLLKDNKGRIMHLVNYNDDWFADNVKKDGGWSLELIDPANPCAGKENWIASPHASGGTPGRENAARRSNPDTRVPEVVRAYAMDSVTLMLVFNEAVDSLSLLSAGVYVNGIGAAVSVKPAGTDFYSAFASFATPFAEGTVYRVLVTSVHDCAGKMLGDQNYADFGRASVAAIGDIIINEILFNPRTGGSDFVELYNRSQKIIDLRSLYVANTNEDGTIKEYYPIAPAGYTLVPGTYCVLSEDPAAVMAQYSVQDKRVFLQVQLPSFNDDAGTCVVMDLQVNRYDELKYDDDMHFALLDDEDGVSLERIDFNRPTTDRTNWTSAAATNGYATPGYKNSQYKAGGNVSGLLTVDPEVFSPDGDGYNDLAHFSWNLGEPGYTGSLHVYNSSGVMIRNLMRNDVLSPKGTISWDGITEDGARGNAGIYVAELEVFNLKGDVRKQRLTFVLGAKL